MTKDALAQKVKIFRRENKNTKIIEVDLTKAKTNPAEDIALEAADIVEVGQRGRGEKKYPPIIKNAETVEKNASELPLRIID